MSSQNKEEPKPYTLLLIAKSEQDLDELKRDIKQNKLIPIYIELTMEKVADYVHGEKHALAEVVIAKGAKHVQSESPR
jgi:hypothetical protein